MRFYTVSASRSPGGSPHQGGKENPVTRPHAVKRYHCLPIVACILLLSSCVPAADAAQCRELPDESWDCSDPDTDRDNARVRSTPAPHDTPADPESPDRSEADLPRPAAPLVPVRKVTLDQSNQGNTPQVDERWELCPPVDYGLIPRERTRGEEDLSIELSADNAESGGDDIYTLRGNAVINYGLQQLKADIIDFNRNDGSIDARGNLHFTGPGLIINGTHARLFPEEETGTLYDIDYVLTGWHGRGEAKVVHLDGRQQQRLEQASYTTCPAGNRDWLLSARELELDHEEGMGVARHAKFTVRDVPVLYTPYITFPTDDRRRSGLLIPKIGSSEETGFDVRVPYYWNIAPNYDATLTPRYMSDRGMMLGTEFRYLHRRNRGQISAEYLPSDSQFDNKDRHLVTFLHNGSPVPRLKTKINASNVSDKDYFQDLGDDLVSSSRTHLKREADAIYYGNRWTLDTRVLDFQTVDPTIDVADRPYKELPRIRFNATPKTSLLGVRFSMDSEMVEFEKDKTVTGTRVDLQPRLTLPVQGAAYYIKPSVSLRHTLYRLDDEAPGDPENPDRTMAVASLDTGLFFDRNFNWGATDYVQTLEPRLFYLFVPNKDQDDIPVFDTGDFDFNFWQLFLENRFSGPDRMGDANQLAVALTTRVLNPATGVQQMSASLGNLFYFRDRKVTLPGEPLATDTSSDIIGQVSMELGSHWKTKTELQWDPGETHTNLANAWLQYKGDKRHLVNLSYRFRRDTLDQTDASFLWPIGRAWHVVGRWNYSIDENQTLETIAGIGYESCCWAVRLAGRSYVNDKDGGRTNSIFLQIELKGLTSAGNSVDNLLERGIFGYEPGN